MRMLVLLASALISMNSFAGSSLSSAIIGGMQKNASEHRESAKLPFVYGGQDISRSVLATANESLWAGQPTLVG